jgi:hypothetical protein
MRRSTGRRGFERQPARREVGRKIIIVCEGSKTEKGYFNAIRASLKLPTVQVAVYHPNATNPRGIVEYTRQKRHEQIDSSGWDEAGAGDCAWAVYDGVEHYQHNKRDWDEALDLAQRNGINLAITIERARTLAKQARDNDQKLHEALCAEGVAELVALLLSLAPPR